MRTSQLAKDFNSKVLFQNKKYSIEICDVLHLSTDKKQICVIVDKLRTNWVRPNKEIDFLYLDFGIPRYIVDKTLFEIKKHKNQLFYSSLK